MNSHRVSAQEPRISEEEVQYFISWLELNRPDLAKKAEQKKLFEESLNPPSFRWFRNLVLLYLAESEKSLNPPKRRFPWLRNLVWLVLAESEKSLQPPKSRFRWLRKLVLADPEDFHGKSFVTEELEKHSKITAGFVSGTNLLNFFTNSPLFYYAFKGIGSGPAFILMLAVDLIILKLTNFCGTAAAGGKKGIRCWSLTAVIAFMTMGILQSVVSGMGVELINNRSTLATLRAEEIINKQKNKLQSKYKEAKKDLNKKEEELKSEKNPDNRTHISEDIDGPFHKRHDDEYWRNKPIEELPLSRKVKRLEAEVNKWEHDGNPLLFLKDEKPDIYAQDFKEKYYARSGAEDELRDGAVAVRLAFKNFFNNLNGQEWTKLGLSIFFFSLSLITSVAACFLTVFYAEREDTKMSHSPAVKEEVEEWLEQIRRNTQKRIKQKH